MIESKQIKPRIGDKSTVMLNVPRQRDQDTAKKNNNKKTHKHREQTMVEARQALTFERAAL